MEAKHTPGPWRVVQRETLEDGSVYPAHIVGGATEFEVCQIESALIAGMKESGEIRGTPVGDCTNAANAKLIAAAPELLEALIAAEAALNHIRCTSRSVPWDDTGPAVEQARAAIAKATA